MSVLLKDSVFYITRDLERALGLDLSTPNYYIISNYSQYGKSLTKKYKNIMLIKESRILDTWKLMENREVKIWIDKWSKKRKEKREKRKGNKLTTHSTFPIPHSPVNILVFKNTSQIEKICQANNWNLLNPPSTLANTIEQKISQVKWAGSLKKYFPNYKIKECKNISWQGEKIIIQFNQSHTGSGTILIKNKKQLDELKNRFPKRLARTAKYIKGPLFTNNNIVWGKTVLTGNINYQITGLKPFTGVKFATIGNDWALPHKILTEKQIKQFYKIAQDVGEKMKKSGWKGAFGIDVVMDEKTKKMYLVEINARQSASTTYESQLQQGTRNEERGTVLSLRGVATTKQSRSLQANCERDCFVPRNDRCVTTFQAHLYSLLGTKYNEEELIKIKNGAQIIYRVKNEELKIKNYVLKELKNNNFNIIRYNNTKPNADLLRIQSKEGIMKRHGKFNEVGEKIKNNIK